MKKLGVWAVAICFALVGCSDRRGEAVRTFVAGNPPDYAELAEITGEFPLEAIGDGRFRTNVPVRYRVTDELVSIFDGFGTPEGVPIAGRLDEVRTWAATRLPEGDALRTAIERAWQQARYGFLLKRIETAKGSVRSALVSLELRPTVDGNWLIERTGNTLELTGVPDGPVGIPVEGSEEAAQLLAEVAVTAGGLETMRADWEEEFERRAAAALAALNERLATGMVFAGSAAGEDVELVISRGADRGEDVIAVLRTTGTPQAATRFEGRAGRYDDGSAWWRGRRTDVISSGEGELDGRAELILRGEGEGLIGPKISLPNAEQVDLIPEPTDSP